MNAPMSDERLAEIREHVALLDNVYGCFDKLHRAFAQDVTDLLAEVDRLRAEAAEAATLAADAMTRYQDARAEIGRLHAELREGTANMRAARAAITDERDRARTGRGLLADQVQRIRALCEGGPGPHNERQIWISDVLAIIGDLGEEETRG